MKTRKILAALTAVVLSAAMILPAPGLAQEPAPAAEKTAVSQTDPAAPSALEEADTDPEPEPTEQPAAQAPTAPALTPADEGSGDADAAGRDASAYFHATVTADADRYASGETAIFSVTYDLDRGAIQPGDYVTVQAPADLSDNIRITASPQHFQAVENLGGGTWRLVFGPDAATGLTGSFSMAMTTVNKGSTDASGQVTVGTAAAGFTVAPGAQPGGSGGTFDYGIRKDASGNSVISWKGYDYSDPNNAFHHIGPGGQCGGDRHPAPGHGLSGH